MLSSVYTYWFRSSEITLTSDKSDCSLLKTHESDFSTYLDADNDDCIVVQQGCTLEKKACADINIPKYDKTIDVSKLIRDITSAFPGSTAASYCADPPPHSLSSATAMAVCALQCWLDTKDTLRNTVVACDAELQRESWLYEAMYKYAHRNLTVSLVH